MRAPAPTRLIAGTLLDCRIGAVAPASRRRAWRACRRSDARARRFFVASFGRLDRQPADATGAPRLIVIACRAVQIRVVSPDNQQFAQVLHRRAFELAADSREQRVALAPHI